MTTRFNIDRFLTVLLGSLIDYSSSDDRCHLAVVSIIENVDIRYLIRDFVFRLLSSCFQLSQNSDASKLSGSSSWAN